MVRVGADGQVLATEDCVVSPHGPLLVESPAPLNNSLDLAIREVASTIAPALQGQVTGSAWDVELALTDAAVHVDMVTGVEASGLNDQNVGCRLLVHLYATDAAKVKAGVALMRRMCLRPLVWR